MVKKGWSKETVLILVFAFISLVIGVISAEQSGYDRLQLEWWSEVMSGSALSSIIFSVVMRFQAAWSRSKTGSAVQKTYEVLEGFEKNSIEKMTDFRNESLKMATRSEYRNEMRFLRHMMETHSGANYFRFNFRFETWDNISIRLEPSQHWFCVKPLGIKYWDELKFYICLISEMDEKHTNPPFSQGDKVACCQVGGKYLVSLSVSEDQDNSVSQVYEFMIIGSLGNARIVPIPPLAKDVDIEPRLKDKAGVNFF